MSDDEKRATLGVYMKLECNKKKRVKPSSCKDDSKEEAETKYTGREVLMVRGM